jgi:Flp pilus assembly pilin Flp
VYLLRLDKIFFSKSRSERPGDRMPTFLWSFLTDESGQSVTEYALIIAFVSAAVIGTLAVFRDQLTDLYSTVVGALGADA